MLTVRGNWLGLIMFVLSGLIAVIGGFVIKSGDFITMVSVGISLILMDLMFRLVTRKQRGWLFGKETGGYFFLVPVWILGIIVVIVNIINHSGVLK